MRDSKKLLKILGQISQICRSKKLKGGHKINLRPLVESHSELSDPVYGHEFVKNRKSLLFSFKLTFNQQFRKKTVHSKISKYGAFCGI